MTSFAVCRVEKLRYAKLASVDAHNARRYAPANADLSVQNQVLRGDGHDIKTLVERRISSSKARLRSDSAPAAEVLLSASPEYFRPDDPGAWGAYDPDRMVLWAQRIEAWLDDQYGSDNVVRIDLHLDEATPHIHAIVVPVVECRRKRRGKDEYDTYNQVSYERFWGKKQQLRDMQTSCARAVQDIDIHRGISRSGASHQTVKSFYRELHDGVHNAPAVPSGIPEPLQKPGTRELISSKHRDAWWKNVVKTLKQLKRVAVEAFKNSQKHLKLANLYRKRWNTEQNRLRGYLRKFGSPEGLESHIEKLEKVATEVQGLKKSASQAEEYKFKYEQLWRKIAHERHGTQHSKYQQADYENKKASEVQGVRTLHNNC